MIKAYPLIHDHWRLQPDKWNETYEIKGFIKGCGGTWDGLHWQMNTAELQGLMDKVPGKIEVMHYVLLEAYCCMPEMKEWVNEDTLAIGKVVRKCAKCDKKAVGEELFDTGGFSVKIQRELRDVFLVGDEVREREPLPKDPPKKRRRRSDPAPAMAGAPLPAAADGSQLPDDDLPF